MPSHTLLPSAHRILAAVAMSVIFMGCAYTNEISRTKRDIEAHTDADFQTGVVVSLGPNLFHTAGWLTKFVDDYDAEQAGRMVQGIRRIKAGIYPTSHVSNLHDLDLPSLRRFRRSGWKPAIKIEDRGEVSWLLYRERNQRVHDLFVISLTESELVLARIQGQLDELFNYALTEIEDERGYYGDWR